MGCASSSPLVESGKNFMDGAKESASDVVAKGGKALHDVGDTAKEGLSTGMDHVKEAMESAMTTAENSIGSVVTKIGDTFNATTNSVKATANGIENGAEEAFNKTSDTMAEAVSEAETVIASEADEIKQQIASSTMAEAFEKAVETGGHLEERAEEVAAAGSSAVVGVKESVLELEDVDDMLGDSVEAVEKKSEEIINRMPTPATSPVKEPKKEEPQPTFWEAAADAILTRSLSTTTIKPSNIPMDESAKQVLLDAEKSEVLITPPQEIINGNLQLISNELLQQISDKSKSVIIKQDELFINDKDN